MKPNLDFKYKGTQISEVQDGRIAPSINYEHSERGRSMACNELPYCIQYIFLIDYKNNSRHLQQSNIND